MPKFSALVCVLLALLCASCSHSDQFCVSGKLKADAGKTLYLLQEADAGLLTLDSVQIGSDGSFALRHQRPLQPSFFSLKVGPESVPLAIDSCESVSLVSSGSLSSCSISGAESAEMVLGWSRLNSAVQQKFQQAQLLASSGKLSPLALDSVALNVVRSHKDSARSFIQLHPGSLTAYFMAFGVSKGSPLFPLFNIEAERDFHYFAIIANAWHKRAPLSARALDLGDLVQARQATKRRMAVEALCNSRGAAGFIDLSLPDKDSRLRSLSQLRGRNILLQFCYLAQMDQQAMASLASLQQKWARKGFSIFMVSFDQNNSEWKKMASQCPWIVTSDPSRRSAATYNLSVLPTNFFISASGDIIGRDVSLANVEAFFSGSQKIRR